MGAALFPAVVAALMLVMQSTVPAEWETGTVQQHLDRAAPWDTVTVPSGVHRECLVIDRPVVLQGAPGAVIEGNCEGRVVTVRSPATIRELAIRHSGSNLAEEDAGIWATGAPGLTVEDCVLEDVLFGIYLKQSDDALIRGNVIVGKRIAVPRRGDGIRLWYSQRGRIEHNRLTGVRDLVIWFSDSAVVRHNVVQDSRYGLHYMYSDHSRFEDNRFLHNEVGGFLMYSTDITFERNVFAEARGVLGKGLGFKDAERIDARNNLLVGNAVGIFLDNSPHSVGTFNRFSDNTFAFNDVAVGLLPSVARNRFVHNAFVNNGTPATVSGGGNALANTWSSNYWSDYVGFDTNHDGVGDAPFVFDRITDALVARHEDLGLFRASPAMETLTLIGRILPALRPQPIVIDSTPRMASPVTGPAREPAPAAPVPRWPGALLIALAGGAAAAGYRWSRPRRVASS